MYIFVRRLILAALLHPQTYEDVEADHRANWQALAVVVLSSLAAAVGSSFLLSDALGYLLAHLGLWLLWAVLTFWIGTHLLPEPQTEADYGQLLRTVGFASSPGLIRIFGLIPVLRTLVQWVALVWMLVAMIVAVRQALDYRSTLRAVGVCGIGFLVQMVFLLLATTTAR